MSQDKKFRSRDRTYAKAVYPVPALAAVNNPACALAVDTESCPPECSGFLWSSSTWNKMCIAVLIIACKLQKHITVTAPGWCCPVYYKHRWIPDEYLIPLWLLILPNSDRINWSWNWCKPPVATVDTSANHSNPPISIRWGLVSQTTSQNMINSKQNI